MKRALSAATVYFLMLFTLGFLLGTLRVTLIAPRFGVLAATAAEVPVMLTAAYFTCRWVLSRWRVSSNPSMRWLLVVLFLLLLAMFETLLGALLFARTIADQWAALSTPASLVGLTAQIIAALLPVLMAQRDPPQ
jgi:hypothetical protein